MQCSVKLDNGEELADSPFFEVQFVPTADRTGRQAQRTGETDDAAHGLSRHGNGPNGSSAGTEMPAALYSLHVCASRRSLTAADAPPLETQTDSRWSKCRLYTHIYTYSVCVCVVKGAGPGQPVRSVVVEW